MLPDYIDSFISMMQSKEDQNLSCFINNQQGYSKLTLVWRTHMPMQNQYFKGQPEYHALSRRKSRNYNRAALWRSKTVAKQKETDTNLDERAKVTTTPKLTLWLLTQSLSFLHVFCISHYL